jgi:hypothetical protein
MLITLSNTPYNKVKSSMVTAPSSLQYLKGIEGQEGLEDANDD